MKTPEERNTERQKFIRNIHTEEIKNKNRKK